MITASLRVTSIRADAAYQPRVEGLDPDHVHALEAVADSWPPLKVVRDGGSYLLVDGFHRFAAAQNLELDTVSAEVLDQPEDGDLLALAFTLNASHGRPLNLSDRRAFAARLLQMHPDWSDREIGRRSGLVQPTIAKIRQELEARRDIEPVETRIGRDGRSYSATQKSPATTADAPARPGASRPEGVPLVEALSRLFTPVERVNQRNLVHYFQRLADLLEEQDEMPGFDMIEAAAEACRAVLGDEKAKALAARLGWSSRNIVLVAEALGDVDEVTAP